jgi:hypothetical protein
MQTELIEQPQAWSKPPDTPSTVLAKWLDNAGAGIGAMAVVGVLAWLVSRDWATVAWWALPAGVAMFGALMIARAALDEVFAYADYRAMLADIDSLTQQLEEGETAHDEACDRLTTRIRVLQNELNLERKTTWDRHAGPNSHAAVEIAEAPTAADPVRDDAEKLLTEAFAGRNWGKDAMREGFGMTSTQWAAARDLLIKRGIVVRGNKQTYLNHRSLAEALSALHGVKEI